MAYRRTSYIQFGDTNRTATTGKGNVVKKPKAIPTGPPEEPEVPIFTINATAGEPTSATISGTFPNFHIELVIKEGTDGTNGTNGYCECNCECCNGGGEGEPPCEDSGLHSGEEGWTYDGCHWSYTPPPV